VHTWPEHQGVTLDVYTCNHSRDNADAARQAVDALIDALKPQHVVRQELRRDRELVLDYASHAHGVFIESNGAIVDRQSDYQRVELHDTEQFGKLLRLDGRNQCSEAEAFIYHEAFVHPAAITHPAPADVLVLGGGDGGAVHELLKHPSVRTVTLAEIDEVVLSVCDEHLGAVHQNALKDSRVAVKVVDGALFLAETAAAYDLILLDLTDEEGPSAPLYQPNLLELAKSKLRTGGLLVAHIDAPFGRVDRLQKHYRALRQSFGIVRVQMIQVPIYGELALAVCSDDADPLAVDEYEVRRRLRDRGIDDLLTYDEKTHHAKFALSPWARRALTADATD
jgi:spermidine synthase